MGTSTRIAAARYAVCIDVILRWHIRAREFLRRPSLIHGGGFPVIVFFPVDLKVPRILIRVKLQSRYRVDQSDCTRSVSHCANVNFNSVRTPLTVPLLPLTCCVRYKYRRYRPNQILHDFIIIAAN